MTGVSGVEFGIVGRVEARKVADGELVWSRPTIEGHVGTGNPAPWNSHMQPGDIKWSCSRIALDPETGDIKWGYQTTPNDGWDFDGVNEVVSFDLNGVKAAATAGRNGLFYILDRTNGKFINAYPFVNTISWAKQIDKNGRPVFTADNRPGDPTKSANGKKGISVFSVPSFLGGKNWMPVAFGSCTQSVAMPRRPAATLTARVLPEKWEPVFR